MRRSRRRSSRPARCITIGWNQIDGRLTKLFKLGGTQRVQAQFDFYNLLNTGSPLGQNNTYGTAWLTPTVIPNGRMLKIGAQYDL